MNKMKILSAKKINCDNYINKMSKLYISEIKTARYHILDDSRVYVKYEFGYDRNYGDLYISIACVEISDNMILEEFVVKAYFAIYMDHLADSKSDFVASKNFVAKSIYSSAKAYLSTTLIPIKIEEIEIQFMQWFNDDELSQMNIDFSAVQEAAYLGDIDFWGDFGYHGILLFRTYDKIFFVEFESSC